MPQPQAIGRYELLEELGQGAMGTVYRAKDPVMDRIVALKTIRADNLVGHQQDQFRERFYREARAAGALAHPGIVPVFDVGEHHGQPFLVMEFVKGRTLADLGKSGERLPVERICEIGQQVAEALGYAHKNGVVHRDIKTANILLTSRESYGIERPKIADFGVAKLASMQITSTGQMLGTPAFMPPEQFTGGTIDGRADLFALGVVLYYMATGEYPFPGETLTTVSYKVVNTDPVPPRKLNPAIPERLDKVILKCLAKSPAERYQNGEELARDLAALRGVPPRIGDSSLGGDPQATLDPFSISSKPTVPNQGAPAARSVMPLPALTKKDNRALLLVVGALVIAVVGLYIMQRKNVSTPGTPATIAPAAPIASAPRVATSPAPAAPVASEPVKTPPVAAPKTTGSTPPRPAALSSSADSANISNKEPAPVNFNPQTLSPNENGRLRVDVQRLPPDSELLLLMDGKLYFRRTAAEFKHKNDDLYLPPGVHEFRVRARNGPVLKISNIASADFKAKKKQTLRIELRVPPAQPGTATPAPIAAASGVFISLR